MKENFRSGMKSLSFTVMFFTSLAQADPVFIRDGSGGGIFIGDNGAVAVWRGYGGGTATQSDIAAVAASGSASILSASGIAALGGKGFLGAPVQAGLSGGHTTVGADWSSASSSIGSIILMAALPRLAGAEEGMTPDQAKRKALNDQIKEVRSSEAYKKFQEQQGDPKAKNTIALIDAFLFAFASGVTTKEFLESGKSIRTLMPEEDRKRLLSEMQGLQDYFASHPNPSSVTERKDAGKAAPAAPELPSSGGGSPAQGSEAK